MEVKVTGYGLWVSGVLVFFKAEHHFFIQRKVDETGEAHCGQITPQHIPSEDMLT